MRSVKIFLFLFLACFCSFGQKSVILHRSDYRHDYALSTLRMIEDVADTARCKYIATLRITGAHHDALIGEALTLMKIKAKELGANLYCITSYGEFGPEAEVTIRLFFGGNKYVEVNDAKRKQNIIVVFNHSRSKTDSGFVYVNGERKNFDQRKFHLIIQETGVKYKLQTAQKSITKLTLSRKKPKEASFVVVPSKKVLSPVYVPTGAAAAAVVGGAVGFAVYFAFKKNLPEKISYDMGRFLYEIYK